MKEDIIESGSRQETAKEERFDPELRRVACAACPLRDKYADVCSSALWMDPKTGKTSAQKKRGYVRGCGCLLSRKTANPGSKCPAGRW